MPSVSVIIASYNHAQYIAQSIESVVRQTFQDFELIVIDDGSTDNSVEVIQALQKKHKFQFIVQDNMGLAKTLNKAVSLASGEFIAPFGSDDIMMLDRLEKQASYMKLSPQLGISGGNILCIDGQSQLHKVQKIYPARVLGFDDIYMNREKGVPAPTLMFRKKVLLEAEGFNPDIRLEDLYIEFKIASMGYQIGMLNDVLAYYRIHDTNTYKNLELMLDAVLATYDCFSDHPQYEQMRQRTLHSYLLMAAKSDKQLARKILSMIPLSAYCGKTFRGIFKLLVGR
ncbi:glycosyltransferase family 2 protein [Endozoicomonas numazuensis]|uniref:Glycosyl transferase n=1 Tax=Endozoicomonas numazuensis TaxID=1137799 RepID=A0A081NIM5_9GAMM|nr:glycosyltransferase family A protein [Endozoicomonas numazuensis]KEQ18298.1 glycosyl transferase [Endozoicomonas numazuensis]